MQSSYDPSIETQATLANVVGHDAAGQLELHEPGPRVENAVQSAPTEDPRQCYLPGVVAVRVGAQWRRDSAEGPHVPWTQLELQMRFIAKRRGRTWSANDRETMRNVELQSWGVVECADRKLVIPTWMRAPSIDTPNGELELGKKRGGKLRALRPGPRMMLAWVWLAFEAGTGGVYMSRAQWAEMLGVDSLRTIDAYREQLEDAGLIRIIRTHAPATFGKLGLRRGSQDDRNLYRIGPALDCVALAAFERSYIRAPRGRVDRQLARELAVILRGSAREHGRRFQHAHHERRAASVGSRAAAGGIVCPGVLGRSPGGGAQHSRPADAVCAHPAENAILPAHPMRGVLGGPAVLRTAAGAAPQDPRTDDAAGRCSAVAERSSAPRPQDPAPLAAREPQPPSVATARAAALDSTSRTAATLELDPAASRRRAPALGAAPRKRTWQDAAAELGRTLEATGNRDAAECVSEALASIGITLELERPPQPPPSRAALALELLERERLRESLAGAALFDHTSDHNSDASTIAPHRLKNTSGPRSS